MHSNNPVTRNQINTTCNQGNIISAYLSLILILIFSSHNEKRLFLQVIPAIVKLSYTHL